MQAGVPLYVCMYVCIMYCIYRKYLDSQAWANSVDPDKTRQNAASHHG